MDLLPKPGLLSLLPLLALMGCAGGGSSGKASASPSAVQLTSAQALDIHRILHATAQGVDAGPPITVLPEPASGVRWSDLHQAVIDGGMVEGVAIKSIRLSNDSDATYELLTLEGWPGHLRAHRMPEGIMITVRMGPYPRSEAAVQRAQRMVKATQTAMRTLGAIPKVEPYVLGTSIEGGAAR